MEYTTLNRVALGIQSLVRLGNLLLYPLPTPRII